METCHEIAYRCSRAGRADRGPDVYPACERGASVPGELVIRVLLIETTCHQQPKVPDCISGAKRPARSRPRSHLGRWVGAANPSRPIGVLAENRDANSLSAAERRRIDVETKRCRE